jgi:hypothetical protein
VRALLRPHVMLVREGAGAGLRVLSERCSSHVPLAQARGSYAVASAAGGVRVAAPHEPALQNYLQQLEGLALCSELRHYMERTQVSLSHAGSPLHRPGTTCGGNKEALAAQTRRCPGPTWCTINLQGPRDRGHLSYDARRSN